MNQIDPKVPEFIQNIEWLKRHGRKHWKAVLIWIAVGAIGLLLANLDWSFSNEEAPQTNAPIQVQAPKKHPGEETQEVLSAPSIKFSDGSTAVVSFSVQAQLDPNLLIEAHTRYGSQEAASNSFRTSVMGAVISTLETKTQDFVRKNRHAVEEEIIKKMHAAETRTAYKVIELSIGEIY